MKASPGIAIIEPIDEKEEKGITTAKENHRIIPGKIVAMGRNLVTDFNALIETAWYGKVGDVVHFLHYAQEGGHDITYIKNKKYFVVKVQDIRINIG